MSLEEKFEREILFGRYRIYKKLASGGMADIYLARQVGVGNVERTVVIKCIKYDFAEKIEFVNMFLDEAQITAQLTHPNIVQIYEVSKLMDIYYLAMEWIRGVNLRKLLKYFQRTYSVPPFELIASLFVQIAEGLHYAHTAVDERGNPLGIIHRDISPSNFLLSSGGIVKIADFGVAKSSIDKRHKTQAGMLKGKYSYMSPEQIRGAELDPRSDIFSLGIVMYEMTTYRHPFYKENDLQTLQSIVHESPPLPSKFFGEFPPALESIIIKCLAKSPEERFSSASELASALEEYLKDSEVGLFKPPDISKKLVPLFERELKKIGKPLGVYDYKRFASISSQDSKPTVVSHVSSGISQSHSPLPPSQSSSGLRDPLALDMPEVFPSEPEVSGTSGRRELVNPHLSSSNVSAISSDMMPPSPSHPSAINLSQPFSPPPHGGHSGYSVSAYYSGYTPKKGESKAVFWFLGVFLLLVIQGGVLGYFFFRREATSTKDRDRERRERDNKEALALYLKAYKQFSSGDYDSSLEILNKIEKFKGLNSDLLNLISKLRSEIALRKMLLRGENLIREGKLESARAFLQTLSQTYPSNLEIKKALETVEKLIQLRKSEKSESITSKKSKIKSKRVGLLSIRVKPSSAEIFLNSKRVGAGKYRAYLKPGDYTVEIKKRGYISFSKKLSIKKGEKLSFNIALRSKELYDREFSKRKKALLQLFRRAKKKTHLLKRVKGSKVALALKESSENAATQKENSRPKRGEKRSGRTSSAGGKPAEKADSPAVQETKKVERGKGNKPQKRFEAKGSLASSTTSNNSEVDGRGGGVGGKGRGTGVKGAGGVTGGGKSRGSGGVIGTGKGGGVGQSPDAEGGDKRGVASAEELVRKLKIIRKVRFRVFISNREFTIRHRTGKLKKAFFLIAREINRVTGVPYSKLNAILAPLYKFLSDVYLSEQDYIVLFPKKIATFIIRNLSKKLSPRELGQLLVKRQRENFEFAK